MTTAPCAKSRMNKVYDSRTFIGSQDSQASRPLRLLEDQGAMDKCPDFRGSLEGQLGFLSRLHLMRE